MTPVKEFHDAFGLSAPPYPQRASKDAIRLRLRLVREEFNEVADELEWLARNSEAPLSDVLERYQLLLKELCDLRYVTEGTAVALGLPIDAAYLEVHRSNMSKLGADGKPIRDRGGKVLKGPNYSPADMSKFVHIVEEGAE